MIKKINDLLIKRLKKAKEFHEKKFKDKPKKGNYAWEVLDENPRDNNGK